MNLMMMEETRLNTFYQFDWASQNPHLAPNLPFAAARAGMFYKGVNDELHCFNCGGIIAQWRSKDVNNLLQEHLKYFPGCSWARRQLYDQPMMAEDKGFVDEDMDGVD